jgi:hypothetical protein
MKDQQDMEWKRLAQKLQPMIDDALERKELCYVSFQLKNEEVIEGSVKDTGSDGIISLMSRGRRVKIDLRTAKSIERLHRMRPKQS